jgi:hypothetical protein
MSALFVGGQLIRRDGTEVDPIELRVRPAPPHISLLPVMTMLPWPRLIGEACGTIFWQRVVSTLQVLRVCAQRLVPPRATNP